MEYVADHPESLSQLRDEMGLTTIMPESFVCHTSGFRASEEIVARSPFEDWRSREDLWPKARDGIYPPVAGTVGGFDDAPLLRVIEAARSSGIEVWGHLGLWSYGGDVFPEFAMVDIEGRPLDPRYKRWGTGLCPTRPEIANWVEDCFVDVVQRYDIDGFCVDHARYPSPSNLSSLFACACDSCQQAAADLGYNYPSLRSSLRRFLNDLQTVSREQILGTFDSSQFSPFEKHTDLQTWFRLRSSVLANQMGQYKKAAQDAAGREIVFGSDVFAPSISLIGGQDLGEWETVTDYITGGSPAGGIVGWASAVSNVAQEWAPALCEIVEGLSEEESLRFIYRLFDYDDLPMPRSLEGLSDLPVGDIFRREVERLVEQTSGSVPLYPPISANLDVDVVQALCEAVVDLGCDGVMFTANPDDKEQIRAIGSFLT